MQLFLCNLWGSAHTKESPTWFHILFILHRACFSVCLLHSGHCAVFTLFPLTCHLPYLFLHFSWWGPPHPPSLEQRSSKKTLHWPSPPMLSVCSQLVFLSPLLSPINERSSLTSLSSFSPFSRLLRNVKTIWHLPGTSCVCVCGCVCTQRNRWINWETFFFFFFK